MIMKRTIGILVIGILLFTTSCEKTKFKMEVVKDCTGVYLRDQNGKDFYVCNDEILEGYTTGTKIKVSYDNLEQCFGLLEVPSCEMVHLNSGVIEVTEIF